MPGPTLGDYPDRLNPAPPPMDFGNDDYRARIRSDAIHVAKIVATFAAVARVVPGPAGKIIGSLAAGMHKQPDTGKLFPTIGTLGNFLPTPLGYADANSYGMRHNWWVPDYASLYVPRVTDRYVPGMADQRRIDSFLVANQTAQRLQLEVNAIEQLTDAGVRAIANSELTLSAEVQRLRQSASYSGFDLKTLAQRELAIRALPERPPPLVPVIVEQTDGKFRAALVQLPDAATLPPLNPPETADSQDITIQELSIPGYGAAGTFSPLSVKPGTLLAIASFERIEFARQEYVTERADP